MFVVVTNNPVLVEYYCPLGGTRGLMRLLCRQSYAALHADFDAGFHAKWGESCQSLWIAHEANDSVS